MTACRVCTPADQVLVIRCEAIRCAVADRSVAADRSVVVDRDAAADHFAEPLTAAADRSAVVDRCVALHDVARVAAQAETRVAPNVARAVARSVVLSRFVAPVATEARLVVHDAARDYFAAFRSPAARVAACPLLPASSAGPYDHLDGHHFEAVPTLMAVLAVPRCFCETAAPIDSQHRLAASRWPESSRCLFVTAVSARRAEAHGHGKHASVSDLRPGGRRVSGRRRPSDDPECRAPVSGVRHDLDRPLPAHLRASD